MGAPGGSTSDKYWVQGGSYGGYRNTSQTIHGSAAQAAYQAATARANQDAYQAAKQARAPAVKNTGIEVGEVEAWRAWRVEHGWLYSMIMGGVEWEPGKPMEAHNVDIPMGEGIHAFKTRKQALDEYEHVPYAVVVGRVLLWGDLIEFTKGFHAEFAAVKTLEYKNKNDIDLEALRKTYGVGE